MSTTWYVVDSRTRQIVNAVSTESPFGPDLSLFIESEHLYATVRPTQEQLDGYEFYRTRP